MRLQKSVIALLSLFIFSIAANAQFGDLINKAKKQIDKTQNKVEQTTTQTTTNNNGDSRGTVTRDAKLGEPGSIGLSKSPIDPKNWQAAKYETSFTANDNIYAIIFFGEPVTKLGINDSNEEMIVWFDNGTGVMTDYWGIPIKVEQKNATLITLPINPAPSDVFNQNYRMAAQRFLEMAANYNNKKGSMKMLAGGDKQAQTEVIFDFTNGKEIAAERAKAFDQAVAANSDKANANNPLPQAEMNNPALERQFATLINAKPFDWKLLKVIIASPEWQIMRHEISGVILNRYVVTRNVVKESNGACRIMSIVFAQDHNGSNYGKTYLNATMVGRSDDYAVSCDKVK